tara:strand:+ start:189 stop:302 length:114 start_codon:yes stop_codon:yes gene_type:complete
MKKEAIEEVKKDISYIQFKIKNKPEEEKYYLINYIFG